MAEKKRPSVSKKKRVAPPGERASSLSAGKALEPMVEPPASVASSTVIEPSASSVPLVPTETVVSAVPTGEKADGKVDGKAVGKIEGKASGKADGKTGGKADGKSEGKRRPSLSEKQKKRAKIVVPKKPSSHEPESFEIDAFDASVENPVGYQRGDGGDEWVEGPSGSRSNSRPEEHPDSRRRSEGKRRSVKKRRMWPKVVFATILTLCLLVVGLFSWHRWFHGDDARDMLGVWNTPGGSVPVMIEGNRIVLSEDVAYEYVLDTGAKTIEFTFGQMKGQGYYHFSLDRKTLVLQDGVYTWFDTLSEDISWVVQEVGAYIRGEESPAPQGDNVTVFVR